MQQTKSEIQSKPQTVSTPKPSEYDKDELEELREQEEMNRAIERLIASTVQTDEENEKEINIKRKKIKINKNNNDDDENNNDDDDESGSDSDNIAYIIGEFF